MERSQGVQVIIVVIILGSLGWLLKTVFSMNGVLGRMDTQVSRIVPVADAFPAVRAQVTSTAARVDRIADVLPSYFVRVAKEELSKPVKTAILAASPRENRQGDWEVVINVYDVAEGENFSYTIPVEGKDDLSPLRAALGTAAHSESEYCSLEMAAGWLKETGDPKAIPSGIDQKASVIMRSTNASQLIEKLPWQHLKVKKSRIKTDIPDTKALLNFVHDNPEKFQAVKKNSSEQ